MANAPNQARTMVAALVLLVITAGTSQVFREDFAKPLGFWGSLLAGTVISGIIVFVAYLALKAGWRKALAIAILLPVTFNTFDAIGTAMKPGVGAIVATAIGGISAIVIGLALGFLVTLVLGITWDEREDNPTE